MRRELAACALAACGLAACGSDDKAVDAATSPAIDAMRIIVDASPEPAIDAPVDAKAADANVDAKPSSVQVLASCAGASPVLTVSISGTPTLHYVLAYAQNHGPDSIAPDDVVEFQTEAIHDAQSGTPGAPDGNFHVGFSKDECLKFTQAGTFPFYCSIHQFTAQVVVK